MKLTSLIILTLSLSFKVNAQEMEYFYDNAGNRIQRLILVQKPNGEGKKSKMENDSIFDKGGIYDFVLFPNPTTGDFQIQSDPEFMMLTDKKIQVYDLSGRFVKEIIFSETNRTIDISDQSTGTYIVNLTASGGFRKEWRLLKE